MNSHQIWRVWLKKWACHALKKFQKSLAGNPNLRQLEPSNLVQSGYLLRLTTGENLVLISQTIFEKLEFENFVSSIQPQIDKKIVFEVLRIFLVNSSSQSFNLRKSANCLNKNQSSGQQCGACFLEICTRKRSRHGFWQTFF